MNAMQPGPSLRAPPSSPVEETVDDGQFQFTLPTRRQLFPGNLGAQTLAVEEEEEIDIQARTIPACNSVFSLKICQYLAARPSLGQIQAHWGACRQPSSPVHALHCTSLQLSGTAYTKDVLCISEMHSHLSVPTVALLQSQSGRPGNAGVSKVLLPCRLRKPLSFQ